MKKNFLIGLLTVSIVTPAAFAAPIRIPGQPPRQPLQPIDRAREARDRQDQQRKENDRQSRERQEKMRDENNERIRADREERLKAERDRRERNERDSKERNDRNEQERELDRQRREREEQSGFRPNPNTPVVNTPTAPKPNPAPAPAKGSENSLVYPVTFYDVTRKTNGEWLRAKLEQPKFLDFVELHNLSYDVGLLIHEVWLITESGRRIDVSELTGKQFRGEVGSGKSHQIAAGEKIVAVDVRAESMGGVTSLWLYLVSRDGLPAANPERP